MSKIVITGGSGTLGTHLSKMLQKSGYEVAILSRDPKKVKDFKAYQWDVEKGTINEDAINNGDIVVHLAGESVAGNAWSPERKKRILESRTHSTITIANHLQKHNIKLKKYIGASAIGFYGFEPSSKLFTEDDKPGNDYLADVCIQWENAHKSIENCEFANSIVRIGVVFDTNEGALAEMVKPFKIMAGAALGSGKQFVPWIHINDVSGIFVHLIKHPELSGIFNAVAPDFSDNTQVTKAISKTLKKPMLPFNVPSFVLKTVLGEQANLVLQGNKISAEKIEKTGFQFQFKEVEKALQDLL
jgi:uncharacterized protein (TIGR01777 family)